MLTNTIQNLHSKKSYWHCQVAYKSHISTAYLHSLFVFGLAILLYLCQECHRCGKDPQIMFLFYSNSYQEIDKTDSSDNLLKSQKS